MIEALLDRLLADDRDAYFVLADALQRAGDPRGELIAVQLRREDAPDDPALAAYERELVSRHPAWWGALWDVIDGGANFWLTFRRGFFHHVRLGTSDGTRATTELPFADMIARLATVPDTQLVRALELRAIDDGRDNCWQPAIDAIAAHGIPPHVARLTFDRGNFWELPDTRLGDLSPAYPRLARLQELVMDPGLLELGAIALPALRALTIRTIGMTGANLASIAAARWPALARLELWLGERGVKGCNVAIADVDRLLAGDYPQLRDLALANTNLTDAIAARLAEHPLLAQLERLDLSRGTLTDTGARAIVDHAGAFAHLRELDLRHAYLSESMRTALAAMAPRVDVGRPQSPDDDIRRPAILC